ncbi:hypothetical protein QTN25_001501 [Entamoeba marina]
MTSRLQRNHLEQANADLQDIQDIASKTLENILVKDDKLKQMSKRSDDLVFETASYRDDAVKFKKIYFNTRKTKFDIADFFNAPYLKYKDYFEDFTIHKVVIESLVADDIFSIPDPTPAELISLFPLSETVYYHIVTAITTCPSLNRILMSLVPSYMNETVFWYKYFSYLFTVEQSSYLLPALLQHRTQMELNSIGCVIREAYVNYFTHQTLKTPYNMLMQFVQIINETTQRQVDKSFYKCTERLEGLPKNEEDIKYRYELLLMVFSEMFKYCNFLYVPFLGNLLFEVLQMYDINNAFIKVFEFLVAAHCEGLYFTTRYELENLSYYVYYVLKDTYPVLEQKPRQPIINFLSCSLKNMTLKLFDSMPLLEKKPFIEYLLKNGKVGVLKVFLLLFKPVHLINFDDVLQSIQQIFASVVCTGDENHKFFDELNSLEIDPLLDTHHFHNTLELPSTEDMYSRIVSQFKLETLSDIATADDFMQLYTMLPKRLQMLCPVRLYTSSQDGLYLKTLYERAGTHPLLLILSEQMELKRDYYGNSETFIFTIKPKAKKYPHIQGSNHFIICSKHDGLLFGGGTGCPSLGFDSWLNCESNSSPTFNNPAFFSQNCARRCDRVEVFTFC